MRTSLFTASAVAITLAYGLGASAQTNATSVFSANLSLGSSGEQVLALQRLLNRDADTRIASAGPGSLGNETNYFGLLTKTAVVRFQEKYAGEILTPAELTRGNGYVGLYTRAKLNALAAQTAAAKPSSTNLEKTQTANAHATTSSPIAVVAPISADYTVRDNEKINIYSGDAMLESVRNRINDAINSAVASKGATGIALPTITPSDMPSIVIGMMTPQSGAAGARVSLQGSGISSQSVVYFGEKYIVRAVSRDASGSYSFVVPPIPPARYDVAVRTGDVVSNTTMFVVRNPLNPPVSVRDVSPSIIAYGDSLTITGSGFTPQGNVVVMQYQKLMNIPSPDGKTLVVNPTPDALRESAKIGDGTRKIPVSLYVVNDYGFSDSAKSFTMSI